MTQDVFVQLLATDRLAVRSHAARVQDGRARYGWHDKTRAMPDAAARLAQDVDAFGAEQACALCLGIAWDPVVLDARYRHATKPADLAGWIDVKSTRHAGGHLIVRQADGRFRQRAYVLATGTLDLGYWIRGWLLGAELMVDRFWQATMRAWVASQSQLRPIATLDPRVPA